MNTQDLIKILRFYGRFTPSYTKIGYIGRGLFWKRYAMDFSGQRWLVTGATSGIGKGIMRAAAKNGAEVVAIGRNETKLKAVIAELPPAIAGRVTYEVADMSLQSDTQRLLERLVATDRKIDALINNVGMLFTDLRMTSEGRQETFVINLLSHYLLTEGLIKQDMFNTDATVVNMTSGGMYNAPVGTANLNITDPAKYAGKVAYGAHKRGQAILTGYWNKVYGSRGINFYLTHPGWVRTPGVKSALPVFWKIQYLILRSPYQGGETALWLAATQPPTSEDHDAGVWFDHKIRPAHMFETRTPQCTVEEFVAYLDAELAKGQGGETAAA